VRQFLLAEGRLFTVRAACGAEGRGCDAGLLADPGWKRRPRAGCAPGGDRGRRIHAARAGHPAPDAKLKKDQEN
jgi:hypothetical protein